MPRFDGTGPQGQGPLTGRGAGRCAGAAGDDSLRGWRFARWLGPVAWFGRAFGRRRGRAGGRGQGQRPYDRSG